jgi:hypothetical protein
MSSASDGVFGALIAQGLPCASLIQYISPRLTVQNSSVQFLSHTQNREQCGTNFGGNRYHEIRRSEPQLRICELSLTPSRQIDVCEHCYADRRRMVVSLSLSISFRQTWGTHLYNAHAGSILRESPSTDELIACYTVLSGLYSTAAPPTFSSQQT